MRERRRFGSLLWATIAVVMAALIDAAGFGSTVLAQQAQTTGIVNWFGTIKKTAKGGGHNHTVDINFEFVVEPDGSIKGRARARITTEPDQVPACTMLWTYSPSEFDIPLSGRRDGENFEISLDPGTTTATITLAGPCAAGQASNTFPSHPNPAVYAETKYRIAARDGATNTVERNVGALPWGVIMRDTIEIRRDCRDPQMSADYRTLYPFGPETPADIAPPCESCPGGTWKLEMWDLDMFPQWGGERTPRSGNPLLELYDLWFERDFKRQCTYTYEAVWQCTATSQVRRTAKDVLKDGDCEATMN